MMCKFVAIAIALGCFLPGAVGAHEVTGGPFDSFLAELQSHLRSGRNLQDTEGTQDLGETCGRCNRAPFCKAGLQCRGDDGVCLCGFSCDPGTCRVAPTPAPTPAPAPAVSCFSASATVQTASRGIVAMKDLVIGDKVLTNNINAKNKFEEVYAFGHWDPTKTTSFLQIHTQYQAGEPLEVTGEHMLSINGKFSKASSVKEGDTLLQGGGVPTKVTKIHHIVRTDGVYAPLTTSGTLLVDNVVVSSYVSLQEKGNEYPLFSNGLPVPISQQLGIHMVLSPYRLLCIGLEMDGLCHGRNDEGINPYVNSGIQLAKHADTLSFGAQLVLLAVAVALIIPLFAVEMVFGARYGALVAAAGVAFAAQRLKRCRLESFKTKCL